MGISDMLVKIINLQGDTFEYVMEAKDWISDIHSISSALSRHSEELTARNKDVSEDLKEELCIDTTISYVVLEKYEAPIKL